MVKEIGKRKRFVDHKNWWDRGCTRQKKKVHKMFRDWKRGKLSRERYVKERKKLKEFL